jgi:hypothetical protein
LLPCRDCQGIDTRLVLRTDRGRRNYVMTETYLGRQRQEQSSTAPAPGPSCSARSTASSRSPTCSIRTAPRNASSCNPDGALENARRQRRGTADAIAYRLQRL